jgi:enoyl-CoA hydratase
MDQPFGPELLIESRGAIRIVRMNRPDQLNAVSERLHVGLNKVWLHITEDPDARAIVFTGEGRAFSAGGDMHHFLEVQANPVARRREMDMAGELVRAMLACPLPIIAAINGPAVGLGCSLGVLCDIVYMAETAYIADPHVAVGLTAGDGGAPAWPMFMSVLRAKEYLFTGDRISATKAVELGLANHVVPNDELMDTAIAMAERLAVLPPQALQTTKQAINLHITRAVTGVLEYALACEFHSFDTPEHRAIVQKFIDKAK